jgi:hypothetical protein
MSVNLTGAMKMRSVIALVGLAFSFALSTYAQQNDMADQQTVQKIYESFDCTAMVRKFLNGLARPCLGRAKTNGKGCYGSGYLRPSIQLSHEVKAWLTDADPCRSTGEFGSVNGTSAPRKTPVVPL